MKLSRQQIAHNPYGFLAAVVVEAYGISATDPMGNVLRTEAALGWDVLYKLSQLWGWIDESHDEDIKQQLDGLDHGSLIKNREALRLGIIMKKIRNLEEKAKQGFYTLLGILFDSPRAVLHGVSFPANFVAAANATDAAHDTLSNTADDKFALSHAFMRLWLLRVGPAPFIIAWTSEERGNGFFLPEVRDRWLAEDQDVKRARLWLSASFERWYVEMKAKESEPVVIGIPTHP